MSDSIFGPPVREKGRALDLTGMHTQQDRATEAECVFLVSGPRGWVSCTDSHHPNGDMWGDGGVVSTWPFDCSNPCPGEWWIQGWRECPMQLLPAYVPSSFLFSLQERGFPFPQIWQERRREVGQGVFAPSESTPASSPPPHSHGTQRPRVDYSASPPGGNT